MLRRWHRVAGNIGGLRRRDLAPLLHETQAARAGLDHLRHRTHERLANETGERPPAPPGADWAWRPAGWRAGFAGCTRITSGTELAEDLRMFHDCTLDQIAARQLKAPTAPRPVAVDVFGFEGGFLSLAQALPAEALEGLSRRHLVGISVRLRTERPIEVFARLNIRHGPNTEQITRELPIREPGDPLEVAFDLAYTTINEKRVEHVWLDLIFERPAMNRIAIHDLTVNRRPRAEI